MHSRTTVIRDPANVFRNFRTPNTLQRAHFILHCTTDRQPPTFVYNSSLNENVFESRATDLEIMGGPFPFPSRAWELQNLNNINTFFKVILASNSSYLTYVFWHLRDMTVRNSVLRPQTPVKCTGHMWGEDRWKKHTLLLVPEQVGVFDVLLTVHLSIILVMNQLNAQILVL